MENDNDRKLGDELLKQNGIRAGTLSDDGRKKLHESIALGKKRVRRLKWIVGISWGLFLLMHFLNISLAMLADEETRQDSFHSGSIPVVAGSLMLGLGIVGIFAVVCTISLFIRSSSLKGREMEDIRLALRDIEAELKQSQEK
ncbi:MAG TPA: hypothetical protein ENH84_03625 [Phycisphaerae bacterium]|uniref:DUF485 domain-containing protein n=1 Tax=marine sediment metagenome TaxID=412755 RepID=A0A0F9GGS2_9ZZZZ|nr:hypothetical protein [Phycisphaerae bacterium]